MGIGARVTVSSEAMEQVDEVRGGGGYNSSNDTRLHFGLGQAATMKRIEVRWPSGVKQVFQNIPADAIYEVNEEQGLRNTGAFTDSLEIADLRAKESGARLQWDRSYARHNGESG